jgi:hypothetical protein
MEANKDLHQIKLEELGESAKERTTPRVWRRRSFPTVHSLGNEYVFQTRPMKDTKPYT